MLLFHEMKWNMSAINVHLNYPYAIKGELKAVDEKEMTWWEEMWIMSKGLKGYHSSVLLV